MKVESIVIKNFKKFKHLELSLKNQTLNEVSNRFLILGDNGTGKTTLLQAIALPLALATRQINRVIDFKWSGFLPSRFQRWGSPYIELEISFSNQEIEATQSILKRALNSQQAIAHSSLVKLILDGENCYAGSDQEYMLFAGRYYAQQLLHTDPSISSEFIKLPSVFWFDQFRNLASNPNFKENSFRNIDHQKYSNSQIAYGVVVDRLRQYLNRLT